MVNYSTTALDRTFAALTDTTRRAILMRLDAEGPITISEIARSLPIKLPAVIKHLGVLERAELISRSKVGRSVTVRLEAGSLEPAFAWLEVYQRFWGQRLDHLVRHAEAMETAAKGKAK